MFTKRNHSKKKRSRKYIQMLRNQRLKENKTKSKCSTVRSLKLIYMEMMRRRENLKKV